MFVRRVFFFMLFAFSLCNIQITSAQNYISPPTLPGWTHKNYADEAQPGLPLDGGRVLYSSPLIAEMDGNPDNGKEVVVVGNDRHVHAHHSDGSKIWSYIIYDSSCGNAPPLMSSPAVGELFGDGVPYIVLAYGGLGSSKCDGGIIALRASDGEKAWQFSTKNFNKKSNEWANLFGVISTPALADVDGDKKLEIGFASFDRHVYLLNPDGTVRWYYIAADTVFSSPAFANIDNDSDLEMIIGTDISQNTRLKPPTFNGGFVYAFKTKPRKIKRINFRDPKAAVWRVWFNQVMQGAPVVADVLSSHRGKEVIVTSGCFFPKNSKNKVGRWIKILGGESGRLLQTLKAPTCLSSSPAIADIDEDGQLEVIASVNGLKSYGGDGKGRLMAWKAENPEPIWSVIPRSAGSNEAYMGTYIAPVVADIDGNGSLEVLVSSGAAVAVFSARDGTPLSCQTRGCIDNSTLLYTRSGLKNTPAIADINNDGVLEVVAAGGSSSAYIYAWTRLSEVIRSSPGSFAAYASPWPMHRGNPMRTGEYSFTK